VQPGAKGISVHFHYHFESAAREIPLGAWPRVTLAAIPLQLDQTKLRVQCSGDPAGQHRLVADKLKAEKRRLVYPGVAIEESQGIHYPLVSLRVAAAARADWSHAALLPHTKVTDKSATTAILQCAIACSTGISVADSTSYPTTLKNLAGAFPVARAINRCCARMQNPDG
jgi:hypothetical protein